MGNILKLNRKLALDKLSKISRLLFKENGIDYKLNTDFDISYANTYTDNNGFATLVNVGIREIYYAKRSPLHFIDPVVPDVDFVRTILNVYHEYAHCVQKNQMFRQDVLEECEQQQLIQEIACIDNPDYYIYDGNYTVNANEIQAEQFGVENTYNYLCKEFPNVSPHDIENVLVDIVNDKMQNSTYFVKNQKSFESLQEINDAFNKAYDESFDKTRYYYVNAKDTKDVVKLYMQKHSDIKEMYLSLSDSRLKYRYIATVNLQLHPGLKSSYPNLCNTDLSYEVFADDKSEVRSKVVESEFPELFDAYEDQGHDGFT